MERICKERARFGLRKTGIEQDWERKINNMSSRQGNYQGQIKKDRKDDWERQNNLKFGSEGKDQDQIKKDRMGIRLGKEEQ